MRTVSLNEQSRLIFWKRVRAWFARQQKEMQVGKTNRGHEASPLQFYNCIKRSKKRALPDEEVLFPKLKMFFLAVDFSWLTPGLKNAQKTGQAYFIFHFQVASHRHSTLHKFILSWLELQQSEEPRTWNKTLTVSQTWRFSLLSSQLWIK